MKKNWNSINTINTDVLQALGANENQRKQDEAKLLQNSVTQQAIRMTQEEWTIKYAFKIFAIWGDL